MSTTNLFTDLTVIIFVGLLGPIVSSIPRLRVPSVIGELAAGALIGATGLRFIDANGGAFPMLYAIGFAMLMLQAGTHVDIRSPTLRRGLRRGAAALALVSVLSIGVALAIAYALGLGHASLFAVLLAGSSAAVAFPIIEERRLKGERIEFLIAWIALADSITVIVMPFTLAGSGGVAAAVGGDLLILAAGAGVMVIARRVRHAKAAREAREMSVATGWALELRLSVLLLLFLSAIAAKAGASTLFAGFMAGIVLVRLHESGRLGVQLSGLANGFFVPLFFVLLGSRLDLRALLTDSRAFALAVLLAAGATAVHVAASVATGTSKRRWVTGLASSAQLGLPAAAASLALAGHYLSAANAAALVAAGCLTMIPATIGAGLLSKSQADS